MKKDDVIKALLKTDEFKSRIKTLTEKGYNPPKKIFDDISNLEYKLKKNLSIIYRLSKTQKIVAIIFCVIVFSIILLIFVPGLNYWKAEITDTPKIMELVPIADTFIEENSPDTNHGNDSKMIVSDKNGASSNYDARGIVLFDLSEVPLESTMAIIILILSDEKSPAIEF